MGKKKRYMAVHSNPGIDCSVVQANWRKLAKVEAATWERTYFNEGKGKRFCIWLAQDEEQLKKIFTDMDVSWELIIPVEETVPDLWGDRWQEHLKMEATADTLGH